MGKKNVGLITLLCLIAIGCLGIGMLGFTICIKGKEFVFAIAFFLVMVMAIVLFVKLESL